MRDDVASKNTRNKILPGGRLLTTQEVAAFLGVHRKTVYAWTRTQGLPCLHLGNRLRFLPDRVLRWLSAREEA